MFALMIQTRPYMVRAILDWKGNVYIIISVNTVPANCSKLSKCDNQLYYLYLARFCEYKVFGFLKNPKGGENNVKSYYETKLYRGIQLFNEVYSNYIQWL